MDLYAYSQINDIDALAKANDIDVPRLRGYRLMKDEEAQDYSETLRNVEYDTCKNLCQSLPFWNPNACCFECSEWTDFLINYYCPDGVVRWDRIHGKKRRILKFEIKKQRKCILKQMNTFNKYVGRDDVLYIHARIGGGNWHYYHDQVDTKPWFIEKVDDCFDSTYCDIYAKIKEL